MLGLEDQKESDLRTIDKGELQIFDRESGDIKLHEED